MTKSTSGNSGLPAWFLIIGIGGLLGIVAGAILFFGSGSKPATVSSDKPAATAATPAKTGTSSAKPAGGTAISGKLPVTYDEWMTQINSAKPDSYPALMDGAIRVKDDSVRSRVVEALLVKWLDADRGTYLQYLDQLEGSDDEGKEAWPVLVPAFVKAVPQLNEQAASSPDLEEAVQWMTDYYAEQNPTAALDWAKKWLLDDAQESALATIAGQLSKTSLDQAVAVAKDLKSANSRIDAMANIGSELGKTDPQKALAWAQALTDPAEKAAAVEEVMWSMSDTDPVTAAAQVRQINNPDLLQNIGGTIAESLADKNPKQAVDWAEAIPAGAAQDEAITGALTGWAKSDPKGALGYFQSKSLKNGDAAEGIFEQWSTNSPEDAAAQALQVADPTLKERAVTGVVNGWLNEQDNQQVEQWVDQLPQGRLRDVASATVVDALSVNDPQPAFDRAMTIQDPEIREGAIVSAYSGLAQADPEAAKAIMKGNSLTPTDRKTIQSLMNSMPPSALGN